MNKLIDQEDLEVELKCDFDIHELQKDWLKLERQCSPNIFLSWLWIGSWLKTFSSSVSVYLVLVKHKGEIVGLALFADESIRRRILIHSNIFSLNSSVKAKYNMTIEHNGILAKKSIEDSIWGAMGHYFYEKNKNVDEWSFSFVDEVINKNSLLTEWGRQNKYWFKLLDKTPSFYVDYDLIQKQRVEYIDSLSRNTRSKIRSSMRKFSQFGDLRVIEANSVEQALVFFKQLGKLHQLRWEAKGGGAFSNNQWVSFHTDIISTGFDRFEVQIVKIVAGEKVLGYIYSLVKDGVVSMIQSGFDYQLMTKAKPGYVCHYLVILYNKSKQMRVYDFLAGDGQYKRSLSNRIEYQNTLKIQRKRVKFAFEDVMLSLYRKAKSLFRLSGSSV